MSASDINKLLEKTSHWDKDERYMATSDLCNILGKDIKIDEKLEKSICTAVLKQLDDGSNDVQSVAVKCLATLLRKVQTAQVGEICEKLCISIVEGKNELRDIYSIGLKTLIADVPDSSGSIVISKALTRLIVGVNHNGNAASEDIKKECLDNLSELLKRFGPLTQVSDHDSIMSSTCKALGKYAYV